MRRSIFPSGSARRNTSSGASSRRLTQTRGSRRSLSSPPSVCVGRGKGSFPAEGRGEGRRQSDARWCSRVASVPLSLSCSPPASAEPPRRLLAPARPGPARLRAAGGGRAPSVPPFPRAAARDHPPLFRQRASPRPGPAVVATRQPRSARTSAGRRRSLWIAALRAARGGGGEGGSRSRTCPPSSLAPAAPPPPRPDRKGPRERASLPGNEPASPTTRRRRSPNRCERLPPSLPPRAIPRLSPGAADPTAL